MFLLSFNQFTFNGSHYRQINGAPMGSSLSPILSNLYMEHFESNLMEDIPVAMRPLLWLRYVDDILCIYEDMANFPAFLNLINNIRPLIQFTYELSQTEKNVEGSPES